MGARWLLLVALAADGDAWTRVDRVDGITVEQRPKKGSRVVELRFTAVVPATTERLCAEAFGSGKLDPDEPNVFHRKVLEESADGRVTYEQLSAPFIANRDYAVRATRTRLEGGACQVQFQAANDLAPKPPAGYVRIEIIDGLWRFDPAGEGKSRITYTIHSDPAGAIPPFLVEGSRRKVGLDWVKIISRRAAKP